MSLQTGYETVKLNLSKYAARVTLNRPQIHNAFNETMIRELTGIFQHLKEESDLRVVVLTGEGKSFCAGADLAWMKEIARYSYEENMRESTALADLFRLIYTLPFPTIARVNGSAIGGGCGFVAVCDMVLAADTAKFSLSEVKVGVVPACISPYLLKRIGERNCRELFLTGQRFDAQKALEVGIANQVHPMEKLDEAVEQLIATFLQNGPNAMKICKDLFLKIPFMSLEEAGPYTAEVIAKLRISEEGQEGMSAFLEKREAGWRAKE